MITDSRDVSAGVLSAFWLGFWLAVVSIGAKAVDMGPPALHFQVLSSYLHDLAVAAHADVLFACAVGVTGRLVLLATGRMPLARRAAGLALLVFCVASVWYAVLSVQIFTYLRAPLSYPLLYLAGDMKSMQSSVGAFVTPRLVTSLLLIPALYLVAALIAGRAYPIRLRRHSAARAAAVLALAFYAVFAWRTTRTADWINRDDRLLAENPHWVLLASSLNELFTGSMVRLKETEPYPPETLQDFRVMTRWNGDAVKPRFRHRPRNVIVLVLESTAARYLSLYGSRYRTTPRLEGESRHSLVFDNFYCHFGLTSHSLVALTLSIYPGMTWHEYTVERPDLAGTTVAEVLRPHGYRSAFIHSGDLSYSNQSGFLSDRGFDDLWDFRDLGCGPQSFSWGVEDHCLIDGMLQWIDQDHGERPFYLMAWTIQTHHPYPPSEGQPTLDFLQGEEPPDAYDLSRYLNVLHEVDRQVGRLLDGLGERGLADDTLVVITGDHGEAFGDPHDTYGHGRKLYQENVNVPLLLWNPKLFGGGPHSKTIGGHIDISPTVLDLLGLPAPESWQGRSLFDDARPPRAYFYAADHDYLLGIRENDWKYVYDVRRGREYLFDLGRDPREQVNRAAEDPVRCRRLRQRVAAWMDYQERYLAGIEVAKR